MKCVFYKYRRNARDSAVKLMKKYYAHIRRKGRIILGPLSGGIHLQFNGLFHRNFSHLHKKYVWD